MTSRPQDKVASELKRGLLVVIDGIDGSGKSTQVRLLDERLRRARIPAIASCEPTNGPLGQKLRRSALEGRLEVNEEFEVICNDRLDDVRNCIEPGLAAGKIVIVDRYYTSTLCYQAIRGMAPEAILARNQQFAPAPDLIFILDLDTKLAIARVRERGQEPDKFETADLALVRDKFRNLDLPGLVQIDATQPASTVHEAIYRIVLAVINRSKS
jgi:dTMP kinase